MLGVNGEPDIPYISERNEYSILVRTVVLVNSPGLITMAIQFLARNLTETIGISILNYGRYYSFGIQK